jgi:hypothetical protein
LQATDGVRAFPLHHPEILPEIELRVEREQLQRARKTTDGAVAARGMHA